MICSWFGFMNWKIVFLDVWFCFDYFLICFSLFCRFCLFFSADVAIINSYYFFKKKPLKIQFLKKQILYTHIYVFLINYYWLKISWFVFCGKQWKIIRNNFHWKIISIYENYIIVLLFFMILLRRCGRKTISKNTKNK